MNSRIATCVQKENEIYQWDINYEIPESCHSEFKFQTRLPASRSSSIGPEGCFSFFHHKVKIKRTITLNQTQLNSYGKKP